MRLALSTVGSLVDEVIVCPVLVKLTINLYKTRRTCLLWSEIPQRKVMY